MFYFAIDTLFTFLIIKESFLCLPISAIFVQHYKSKLILIAHIIGFPTMTLMTLFSVLGGIVILLIPSMR